ncbi:MAG: hypothetical protein ACRC5A_09995, partial [Enterobacteriaceae bacterium]
MSETYSGKKGKVKVMFVRSSDKEKPQGKPSARQRPDKPQRGSHKESGRPSGNLSGKLSGKQPAARQPYDASS